MALIGADVEQLRTLARTLSQAAEELERMSTEVTSRLSSTQWHGPDADHYQSQWQGQSIAQIRNVVSALRSASDSATRNADAQEQASAAAGGSSAGASGGSVSASTIAPSVIGNLLGQSTSQPFTDISDFLKSSTIWPIQNGTALGATPLGAAIPVIDALGIAQDGSLTDAQRTVAYGQLGADGIGDALKDSGGPVGYLAGAAVDQWADVAQLAAQTDFSPSAMQTVGNYVATDPAGAFDAAKDAVINYVPSLVSNLLPKI